MNVTLAKSDQPDFFEAINRKKKIFDEEMNIKEHASQTENY